MRKSNLSIMFLFFIIIISISVFMFFSKIEDISKHPKEAKNNNSITSEVSTTETNGDLNELEMNKEETKDPEISMAKSLFIGDSRTVGLMEYSQINTADFFCSVGMSVFNIYDDSISIPNIGNVTLTELFNLKEYDRIYIMLGVNEMGYKFEKIVDKYNELITFIKEKEPKSTIFLQANLHVTSTRSKNDDIFNNQSINRLNDALSKIANNKSIYYFDANQLFDDANGDLSSDKSSDNTHLYAKYYEVWGKWIIDQTEILSKEE